jgi:hypothetical protein
VWDVWWTKLYSGVLSQIFSLSVIHLLFHSSIGGVGGGGGSGGSSGRIDGSLSSNGYTSTTKAEATS